MVAERGINRNKGAVTNSGGCNHREMCMPRVAEKWSKRVEKRMQAVDRAQELSFIAASYSKVSFYETPEWKQLRYRVLKEDGAVCCLCGGSPRTGSRIHVDHIKPRSIFPELAFRRDNLQVLCSVCNEGKSNKDSTDWRNNGVPTKPLAILRKKS